MSSAVKARPHLVPASLQFAAVAAVVHPGKSNVDGLLESRLKLIAKDERLRGLIGHLQCQSVAVRIFKTRQHLIENGNVRNNVIHFYALKRFIKTSLVFNFQHSWMTRSIQIEVADLLKQPILHLCTGVDGNSLLENSL